MCDPGYPPRWPRRARPAGRGGLDGLDQPGAAGLDGLDQPGRRVSGGGPAAVHQVRRTGDRLGAGSAEERNQLGHLGGLDQPLHRSPGEQHLVEHLRLADAVGPSLVVDLPLDERRAHVAGHTVLLVTPLPAASRAITFERPSSPCLAATYADLYGEARCPCTEDTWTSLPQPRSYIPGKRPRASRNGASSISRWMKPNRSGSNSSTGATCWMPALFTRMSACTSRPRPSASIEAPSERSATR